MPPVLRDPDFRNVKIWESRCFRISEVCIRVAKFFYSCNNLKICSKASPYAIFDTILSGTPMSRSLPYKHKEMPMQESA